MNLLFCGFCGIGKSTLSRRVAEYTGATHLDLDEIRSERWFDRNKDDIFNYLQPKLDSISGAFILDVGCDTVFRQKAPNESRMRQVKRIKATYKTKVILLDAKKEEIKYRLDLSKKGGLQNFDALWETWLNLEEPYWKKCSDLIFDTGKITIMNFNAGHLISQIKAISD